MQHRISTVLQLAGKTLLSDQWTVDCPLALPCPITTCLAWEGSCLQNSGCAWLAKISFSHHCLPPLSEPGIWRGGICEES